MSQSASELNSQSINETVSQQEKGSVNSDLVSQWVCESMKQVSQSVSQTVTQSLSQCHSYYLLKCINQSVN